MRVLDITYNSGNLLPLLDVFMHTQVLRILIGFEYSISLQSNIELIHFSLSSS